MNSDKAREKPVKIELTKNENDGMAEAYAYLNQNQITAARMESVGIIDRATIATQVNVSPETISTWRSNEYYKKVIAINTGIIDRMSREHRLKCVKTILAPAYAELIKRMEDKKELDDLRIAELLEIIRTMGREVRLDTPKFDSLGEDKDELIELQRRHENAMLVARDIEIDKLLQNEKFISLPNRTPVYTDQS